MKPGVSVSQAQAELSTIMDRLAQQYPDSSAKLGVAMWVYANGSWETFVKCCSSCLGTVSFVLLIACSNIANLLLARASGRTVRSRFALRLAQHDGSSSTGDDGERTSRHRRRWRHLVSR